MDRRRPNKFILAAVEKVFDKNELLKMNPRDIEVDDRVIKIRG